MQLPPLFAARMRIQLADESKAFLASLDESPAVSIRLHHQKGKYSGPTDGNVPWCDTGVYLPTRPAFHMDPHWHAGAYYVQEASSMILDEVLRQHAPITESKIWLDLCAAPGGKTGILAKHLHLSDALVANEVVTQRRNVLYENLVKGGFSHTFITGMQPEQFPEHFADVILLDAPCAGEGMMRKEPEAIQQWTPQLVTSCALLQKNIMQSAARILKPNGLLVYSTCSYSHSENIDNVQQALATDLFDIQTCAFPTAWNIMTIEKEEATGYQLYPHRVRGEGLFIAVLRKKDSDIRLRPLKRKLVNTTVDQAIHQMIPLPGEWTQVMSGEEITLIHQDASTAYSSVIASLPRVMPLAMATMKGKDLIPSHYLAMTRLSAGMPVVDLNLGQALDYLERKVPDHLPALANGWYVATFEGSRLGWLKKISGTWKNHYPMDWRLRKRTS